MCLFSLINEIFSKKKENLQIFKDCSKIFFQLLFIYHKNDNLLETILCENINIIKKFIETGKNYTKETNLLKRKSLFFILKILCLFLSGNNDSIQVVKFF